VQQDRREIRAEGRDHAEAQRPGQRIAPRRGRLLDLVRQGDQGARLGDDLLAQGRHPDAALGALEQGRAPKWQWSATATTYLRSRMFMVPIDRFYQ
jgi:hypothetical protein